MPQKYRRLYFMDETDAFAVRIAYRGEARDVASYKKHNAWPGLLQVASHLTPPHTHTHTTAAAAANLSRVVC